MGIAGYIKEIGRGRDGARALNRDQAADLMGQVLDGAVTDLEVGAFCLAMRIKGETPQEMAGFLDATRQRVQLVPNANQPTVVLPSYNGARKLPVLTPLLALLLARQGLAVLVHGMATETSRTSTQHVLEALDIRAESAVETFMLIRLLPTRKSAIISWSCQPNFHFRHHFRNSCDFSRMTRRVQCIWKASAGQTASSVMVAVGRVSQTALLTAPPLCFVAAIANVTRRSPLARSCNARTHQCRSGFGLPTSCRAKRRA